MFKKLFSAIFMLVIAAALLSTSSFAWFSMNKSVTASGMEIKATSSSSLVIANELAVGTDTTVSYTVAAESLIPAVHTELTETNPSGLLYNSNPVDISTATGLANTGDEAEFEEVSSDTVATHKYYIDFVCYIAASGESMSDTTIEAKLTNTTPTNAFMKAASIDFYVSTDSATDLDYKGTLNLAGLSLSNDEEYDSTDTTTEITIVDSGTIPVNNSTDSWLKVTMRCYFDGALLKDATHTFVTTDTVSTDSISLGVKFYIPEE